MKQANLERLTMTDEGTFGRISFGPHVLFTGELPDHDNAPNISCIPTGPYTCKYTWSPTFKKMMYLITEVPGRSGIRIHSANLMGDRSKGFKSQLYGCIALGEKIGMLGDQKALLVSRPAIRRLENYMNGKDFELWVS